MNKIILYTIIALGLNLLSFILFSIPMFSSNGQQNTIGGLIFAFILSIISLIIQLIVALVFIANEKKKELGKAMLISVGIILLVGLSFCSGLWG